MGFEEAIQRPSMCLCGLTGMECVCDIPCCEELIDNDENVERQPVLIAAHGNVIYEHVIESQCEHHLGRQHPEEVFEMTSLFVYLKVHHPSVICILQLVKLVDNCYKIASQCLYRLALIASGLVKKVGDLS